MAAEETAASALRRDSTAETTWARPAVAMAVAWLAS
jgi:hypothetical protein